MSQIPLGKSFLSGIPTCLLSICLILTSISILYSSEPSPNPSPSAPRLINGVPETIELAADYWYPYNGDPEGAHRGFMVDLATQIFKSKGIQINYRVIPWARALLMAKRGQLDGVIGAYKEDAPDFIFHSIPMGFSQNVFISQKNFDWKYDSIRSLQNIKLGVILDYSYGKEIDEHILHHKESGSVELIAGENPLERNVEKLLRKRVDVIIEDINVFTAHTKSKKIRLSDFNLFPLGEEDAVFIAFSPAKSEQSKILAQILNDGIADSLASGLYKKILESYQLESESPIDKLKKMAMATISP